MTGNHGNLDFAYDYSDADLRWNHDGTEAELRIPGTQDGKAAEIVLRGTRQEWDQLWRLFEGADDDAVFAWHDKHVAAVEIAEAD